MDMFGHLWWLQVITPLRTGVSSGPPCWVGKDFKDFFASGFGPLYWHRCFGCALDGGKRLKWKSGVRCPGFQHNLIKKQQLLEVGVVRLCFQFFTVSLV